MFPDNQCHPGIFNKQLSTQWKSKDCSNEGKLIFMLRDAKKQKIRNNIDYVIRKSIFIIHVILCAFLYYEFIHIDRYRGI